MCEYEELMSRFNSSAYLLRSKCVRLTQGGDVSEKVSEQNGALSGSYQWVFARQRRQIGFFSSWRNALWKGSENYSCVPWKELGTTSGISLFGCEDHNESSERCQ